MSTSAEQHAAVSAQVFFAQLPEFEPDPTLWNRIEALDRRHRRNRRQIRFSVLAGASAAILAMVALVSPGGPWRSQDTDELATSQVTSQQFQDRLESRSSSKGDVRVGSDMRVIDAELQAAYDRNATDEELEALWTLRNEVLRALAADAHPMQSLTRI